MQQGKQSGEAQGRPAARKPEDLMQHYPDAAQMTQRFELFDERVRWIQRMDDRGGRLSIEESEAVKLHDTLLDRLAFLRAGPVANARIQNPPPETRAEASPGGSAAPKNSEPMVRYIGGVKLKSDYSLQDVLAASANAAKSPFASFIASARDLVKKATEGKALSAEEEEQIYRYAGVVDAFVALTPKGGLSRVAGSVLDGVNQAVDGKDADVDDLREKMVDAYKVVQPKTKAQSGSSRGKLSNVNDSGVASRKETPLIVAVPAFGGSPSRPIDLFDYPRFKIPYGASGFRTSGEERIIRKPAFNAPVKLPDGRTGYLLSPTHPPRLPDDKMHEQEPVAGPSGESTVAEVDSATSSGSDSPVSSRTRLRKWGAGGDLKRIAGKGPINVMPAATPLDDGKRITNFGAPFFFYRKDRDVTDMDGPRAVRGTDYDHRREVLVVGDGTQTTSQIARSKISAGTFWGSGPASHLQGAEVIKLGNGRDGVGAIKLPFASIKPGEAVVVSGGAMNGCTMLFASDGKSLYAYHAGLSQLTPNWRTAREGAQAIVDAHVVMGPKEQIRYKWYGSNDDLITIGRQYPFSALIYNSRDLSGTNALVCAGGLLGCVAGGFDVMPTSHINVPRHAYGPRHGPRWHMMTFDYSEQDPNVRTVGTAEAIVAKDLKGRVTVSVLAEKGKLDRRASFDDRAIPIAYKYKTMDSDSAIYEPKT
ncbi:cytotoxic necrotizing factor Rho-activating domain-containing protein [Paraburkholderia solisilvae]|uniref:cytotoxic necrotizing factor Rho-activating domain-containing protein n=1 Tax=Paraburkholderia solisilvae TaxID=624376 RepID=UPI001583EE65|nr:cytotoxic necrotizing factor Rho-activating domain-containing protein [Paraburkholderia solisilvae]